MTLVSVVCWAVFGEAMAVPKVGSTAVIVIGLNLTLRPDSAVRGSGPAVKFSTTSEPRWSVLASIHGPKLGGTEGLAMMTRVSPPLVSGNGVRIDTPYYLARPASTDRKYLIGATFAALVLHAIFLIAPLPRPNTAAPPRVIFSPPEITRLSLSPPRIERTAIPPLVYDRLLPVPAKELDDLGPVAEPTRDVPIASSSVEIMDPSSLITAPPTPTTGAPPFPVGPNFTSPVLIQGTKVSPGYPPIARVARREGHVILTAIIETDGSVSEATVVRVDPPDYGFAASAIEAVLQWQYEPALQNGRPVAVSFTIYVAFSLR